MNIKYRSGIILTLLSLFGHIASCAPEDTGARSQPARAETPAATSAALLSNGDFALATKDPAWPDDWSKRRGISWEVASGTHYLHFTADESGKPLELKRHVSIPAAQEIKAIRVSVRYRMGELKSRQGKQADARFAFRFFDELKIAFSDPPPPIIFSGHTGDWKEAATTFAVPANAVALEISIGLSQAEAGALDIAGISMQPVAEAVAPAPAATPDPSTPSGPGTPVPVRHDEGHTIIGYGKPSVWFVGPYVDVVGHDFALGITKLVIQARDEGRPIAVGITKKLDETSLQDEANMTYVFSYKNINYPLPANARRLVFLNTWLTPPVVWPPSRTGKKDLVIIGSKMLHNDGDGAASNKDRWALIQKEDPSLTLSVLDGVSYYLPIAAWRLPLLKAILEDQPASK